MSGELFGNEQVFGGEAQSGKPARPVWPAIRRGLLCRCPRCGEGKLFKAFTKTFTTCAVCGEHIDHHRADDLPAYLVIMIVGHVVVGALLGLQATTDWPTWQYLALFLPMTVVLSLGMLQPIKGGVIGLQWALHMHGFGGEADKPDDVI